MSYCLNINKRATLLALIAAISLAGCSKVTNTSQNNASTPDKTISTLPIPEKIRLAALPTTGTLSASIYMDSSGTAAATQSVNVTASSVSFTLDVPAGDHNFTIIFNYDDATFAGGPFELASSSTTKPISVTAGATQNPIFTDYFAPYTYNDSDSDGVPDITELDSSVRTDPLDSTCVLDKSVIGDTNVNGCTLG